MRDAGCGMRDAELNNHQDHRIVGKSWVGITGLKNSIGDPHDQ